MTSSAAISIYLFGLTSFIAGVLSLIDPSKSAEQVGSPLVCVPVGRGNSLAAIGMGIYYTLAAYQENKAFFAWTVPMRLLTTTVFWIQQWKAAAIWEGIGALLTLTALMFSTKTASEQKKGA